MAFQKGQSGNPKGRPKGTRDRITEAFLRDLEESWRLEGQGALKAAREEDPLGYVKVVAALLPREFTIEKPLDGLSDTELADLLVQLSDLAARIEASGAGAGEATKH